jgi:hypothetical protein
MRKDKAIDVSHEMRNSLQKITDLVSKRAGSTSLVNNKSDLPGYLVFSLVLLLSFLARILWLGNLPGINGDEAWYGLQVIGTRALSWQTPTGNPLNPFYILPLRIIQQFSPPALWVLRLPALLAGLLLLILGFVLLRKCIGTSSAVVFLILSAGLPDLIVYSRFGWDTSETGLAMLIVFYFAFSKRWWLCLAAVIGALLVHPSNIFALVILIVVFGAEFSKRIVWSRRNAIILGVSILVCSLSGVGLLLVARRAGIPNILTGEIAARILNLPGWLGMISAYGDLLSGVTVYRYIAGPVSGVSLALHNIIFWFSFLPIVILGCWRSIRRNNFRVVALLGGLAASLAVVYIFLGAGMLAPGHERYSQFLVVPSLLLISLCIDEIFFHSKTQWKPIGLALAFALLGLFSLTMNYFIPIFTYGGQTHRTFNTGPHEPKAEAVAIILNDNPAGNRTTILAEDWWIAEPMQYLLSKYPEFEVVEYDTSTLDGAAIEDILKKGGYVVGFTQGPLDTTYMEEIQNPTIGRAEIFGYSGKPILTIWHSMPFPLPPRTKQ